MSIRTSSSVLVYELPVTEIGAGLHGSVTENKIVFLDMHRIIPLSKSIQVTSVYILFDVSIFGK